MYSLVLPRCSVRMFPVELCFPSISQANRFLFQNILFTCKVPVKGSPSDTSRIYEFLNTDSCKVLCFHQFQQCRQDVLPDIGVLFLIVHVLHGMIQTPFFVSFLLIQLTQHRFDDTLVSAKSQEERNSQ